MEHLFFECQIIKKLWDNVESLLHKYSKNYNELKKATIMFNNFHNNYSDVANLIGIVTKQYIYKQRCMKKPINYYELRNDILRIENIECYIATKHGKLGKHNKK